MDDIFVSYSRKDRDGVERLKHRLELLGYGVWMDLDDLRAGRTWRRQIVQGIEDCVLLVIVLTTHSIQSDSVRRELDLARRRDKHILPILMDPKPKGLSRDMEYQLVGLQLLNYERLFEEGVETLLEELTTPTMTAMMSVEDAVPAARLEHESGTVLPLPNKRLIVGRGPAVDVDVSELDTSRFVSKRHVVLKPREGNWFLRVCYGASNPTQVNGVVVPKGREVDLASGDEIRLANLSFRFATRAQAQG